MKGQFIGMNLKQRVRKKMQQMSIEIFFGLNRLFFLVYTNQDVNSKRFKIRRYCLPKGTLKNYK